MCDPTELLGDGLVDLWDPMAMYGHPQGGNTVQIPPAFCVDELEALGALDDQRLAIEPVLHLRERMPQMSVIEVG
jgi:hypothetical protein